VTDDVRGLIAAKVKQRVRLRLGRNATIIAVAGDPVALNGGEADAIADAVMAVLAEERLIVAAHADLVVAWAWAAEGLAELPDAKGMDPAVRERARAALDRLYALLETPQPAPENAVLHRRELLSRMTADGQDTYGKPASWFEDWDSPEDAAYDEPLIDPDCRDGKCGSCMGGPCEHHCHKGEADG
jgi:hypothetical protein